MHIEIKSLPNCGFSVANYPGGKSREWKSQIWFWHSRLLNYKYDCNSIILFFENRKVQISSVFPTPVLHAPSWHTGCPNTQRQINIVGVKFSNTFFIHALSQIKDCKSNLNWPSMQRWQCPSQNYYFQLWFLYKIDLRNSTLEKLVWIIKI